MPHFRYFGNERRTYTKKVRHSIAEINTYPVPTYDEYLPFSGIASSGAQQNKPFIPKHLSPRATKYLTDLVAHGFSGADRTSRGATMGQILADLQQFELGYEALAQ